MIEIAEKIVEHAFRDKKDLAGKPYIDHLKRVRSNVAQLDNVYQSVALLHDLLEDCPEWNPEVLRCFFWNEIVEAVEVLTKDKKQDYESYIEKVGKNRFARRVKLADLKDNMDITRLTELTEKDFERLKKYQKAYHYLTSL